MSQREPDYETAKYDLKQGLVQGQNPIVSSQGPLVLENVRHAHHGGYAKRFGLTALCSTKGTVFSGTISSGRSLVTNGPSAVLVQETGVPTGHALCRSIDRWSVLNLGAQPIARETPHLAWPSSQVNWFDSARANNVILDVWIATTGAFAVAGDLWFRIVDATTGDVIAGPTQLVAGGCLRCCLVVCGNTIVVLYSASTTTITAARFDCSSLAGVQAGIVGTTNLVTTLAVGGALSTHNAYAATPSKTNTSQFYLVYETFNGAVSALHYTICNVSPLAIATNVTSPTRSNADVNILGWAVDHDTFNNVVWVAYSYETAGPIENVRYVQLNVATLAEAFIPSVTWSIISGICGGRYRRLMVLGKTGGICFVGSSSDGTTATTGAGANPATVVAPQTFPIQTRMQVFDSAGGAFTTFPQIIQDCALYSLPFSYNGAFYQWIGSVSDNDTQPTWFLVQLIDENEIQPSQANALPCLEVARWAPRTAITRDCLVNFGNTLPNVMSPQAGQFEVVAPILSGSTRSFLLKRLKADFLDSRAYKAHAAISGNTVMDGLQLCWAGGRFQELGFALYPEPPRYTIGGGGSGAMPAGNYFYKCVYKFVDDAGNIVRSSDSPPFQVAAVPNLGSVVLYHRGLGLTRKQRTEFVLGTGTQDIVRVLIEIYRADPGAATTYYLLNIASVTAATAADNRFTGLDPGWTYTDTVAAANAVGFGTIYTLGARLPFLSAPSMRSLKRVGQRLYGLAPDGSIWYTETETSGLLAQWHPVRQIKVGGGEEMSGLAAHRDRAFAFGERNVYSIVGDGLDPQGKGQAPYVQALNLPGTGSPNAIIETPMGIFYRTRDSMELIGGQALDIQENVRQTLLENPYTHDSIFITDLEEVRWSIAPTASSTTGVEVVYSTQRNVFWINKYYDADQSRASAAVKSYAIWKHPGLGYDVLVLLFAGGKAYYVDELSFLDGTHFNERIITLPYIRGAVATQMGALGKVGVTAKKRGESKLIVQVAYDYSDVYTTLAAFASTNGTQDVRRWLTSGVSKCESFSIRLRDALPDDAAPTVGEGDEILEVAFEVHADTEMGQLSPLAERA